LNSLKN